MGKHYKNKEVLIRKIIQNNPGIKAAGIGDKLGVGDNVITKSIKKMSDIFHKGQFKYYCSTKLPSFPKEEMLFKKMTRNEGVFIVHTLSAEVSSEDFYVPIKVRISSVSNAGIFVDGLGRILSSLVYFTREECQEAIDANKES